MVSGNPHLHCSPPAPILISYLAAPSFLPSIWTLNVIGIQICTGESGEPRSWWGTRCPGEGIQHSSLDWAQDLKWNSVVDSLVSWGRNNCSLDERVLTSGSLSNFLVDHPKMFTDGKVGTFPNSKRKWEHCPPSAVQPKKLVDTAAGPRGRWGDRHPGHG